MDEGTKARMRLHLRGEKARGLDALPVKVSKRAQVPAKTPLDGTRDRQAPVAREAAVPSVAPKPAAPGPMFSVAPLMAPPSVEPFTAAPLSTSEKRARLAALDENEVKGCTRCRLCETRTQTVFGEGDVDAKIFFIGEGPGENEDLTGRPFVGRAGDLLNRMIAGMGLKRENVFIANVVKCRPPENRAPAPDEVATCTPYLERQLEIVRPRVIVTLGLPAMHYMLNTKNSMAKMRGQWHAWRGIKLMPTYHPAYVLRSYTDQVRAAVWGDLKLVMAELGMEVPSKS
jgi:uracil-DNA glycosylase